jgi:hypothetical protein
MADLNSSSVVEEVEYSRAGEEVGGVKEGREGAIEASGADRPVTELMDNGEREAEFETDTPLLQLSSLWIIGSSEVSLSAEEKNSEAETGSASGIPTVDDSEPDGFED